MAQVAERPLCEQWMDRAETLLGPLLDAADTWHTYLVWQRLDQGLTSYGDHRHGTPCYWSGPDLSQAEAALAEAVQP